MTDIQPENKKSQRVEKKNIAVIDVGSNSTHMLIVEVKDEGAFRVLDSLKEQTRLAADLDERSLLDSKALTKITDVLLKMKLFAARYDAQVRCVATHTLREARNGREFANRLSRKSGLEVDIISGQEEARLVSLGVRYGLPISGLSTLIVDVGGGSTEIVLCQWNEVRFATSLKLGAVRLTEKFLKKDPFSEQDLKALRDYVVSRLEPVCSEIRRIGFDFAVGSSGTIKSLLHLSLGSRCEQVPKNIHGFDLKIEELKSVAETLFKNRSLRERRLLPNMDPKRADIIVAGAMVLQVLGELTGVRSYQISLSALREGLILDTISRESRWLRGDSVDVRWQSVREFGQRVRLDEPHAWHMTTLTLSLFDSLEWKPEPGPVWRELLRCAAYLHECGKFVNISGFHKHGEYLVKNSSLMGFNQRELELVGALIRFHRKRVARVDEESLGHLDSADVRLLMKLSSLLRLAASLDRGRVGRIRQVRVSKSPKPGSLNLTLGVNRALDAGVEIYEVNCEKDPFERAFGVQLEVLVEDFLPDRRLTDPV